MIRINFNFLVGAFLIITLAVSVSANNDVGKSKFIDPSLTSKFEKQNEVLVTVVLHDESNLSYKDTPLNQFDRRRIFEKKREYFSQVENNVLSSLSSSDFRERHRFATINAFSGYLSSTGFAKLRNDPRVSSIEVDKEVRLTLPISAPLVNATPTWDLDYTGKGQTICVIDGGINWSHPDLGGCLGSSGCKVVGGHDFYSNDADPMDSYGHGTHVAGIAAANGTIKGIAPEANLMAVKVCSDTNDSCGTTAIGEGVDYCVNYSSTYNISVITISMGDGTENTNPDCDPAGKTATTQAINNAHDAGIFVDVSSGNNFHTNGISWPSCVRGATSVGAVYKQDYGSKDYCNARFFWWCIAGQDCIDNPADEDAVTCYTNRDENLDLLAPGSEINSTRPSTSSCLSGCTCTGGYMECPGTSMAAPHVAGAAAILKQINKDLTPSHIEFILQETGTSILDDSTNETFTRIEVYEAAKIAERSEYVNITNNGDIDLNVTLVDGQAAWISRVFPQSFVLSPGENQSVMISIDLDDEMDIGSHTTNLYIESNDPDEGTLYAPIYYQRVHEGCGVGDCPPASGDWTVDEYTAIWLNNTHTTGDIKIQDEATLFLGELKSNITGNLEFTNGTLKLDETEIKFI